MTQSYILYGTEGCHLCENAESLLRQEGLPFRTVDIIHDTQLYTTYEKVIPVLKHPDSGAELYWPFHLDDILAFKAT